MFFNILISLIDTKFCKVNYHSMHFNPFDYYEYVMNKYLKELTKNILT